MSVSALKWSSWRAFLKERDNLTVWSQDLRVWAPLKFLTYNIIGAALWVGFWGTAAFYLGDHLAVLYAWMGRIVLVAVTIGLVGGAAYLLYRGRRKASLSNDQD